jgi:type I restriction enzyme R subunit
MTYGAQVVLDRGDGLGMKSRTVRVLDFDNPTGPGNEFIFTRQFAIQNVKNSTIIPDIVLFVNGIPLAVVECKSPKIPDPMSKAIKQLVRYQELEVRFETRGAPKLFETVQIVAGTPVARPQLQPGCSHAHCSNWARSTVASSIRAFADVSRLCG